jgi:hypothetical protein
VAIAAMLGSTASDARADRFDIARGTVVIDNSPLIPTFDVRSMFGEEIATSGEPDSTLFADDEAPGTVDWVEWQTATPVTIERVRLLAAGDFCTSEHRTFDHFRLLAFQDGDFQAVFSLELAVPYAYDFGCEPSVSRGTLLSRTIPAVTASLFRAEFRQHSASPFSGIRVTELDGFTSERCGDGNDDDGLSASDALAALRTAVGADGGTDGAHACEKCICDITGDGSVSASDALVILKLAVGQGVAQHCPSCFPEG